MLKIALAVALTREGETVPVAGPHASYDATDPEFGEIAIAYTDSRDSEEFRKGHQALALIQNGKVTRSHQFPDPVSEDERKKMVATLTKAKAAADKTAAATRALEAKLESAQAAEKEAAARLRAVDGSEAREALAKAKAEEEASAKAKAEEEAAAKAKAAKSDQQKPSNPELLPDNSQPQK
ncbi:MAG: hypothetical protein AAF236_00760 [Verrucomicrobiota bacterium]